MVTVWPAGSTPTRHGGHAVGVVPSLNVPALNKFWHWSHTTYVARSFFISRTYSRRPRLAAPLVEPEELTWQGCRAAWRRLHYARTPVCSGRSQTVPPIYPPGRHRRV